MKHTKLALIATPVLLVAVFYGGRMHIEESAAKADEIVNRCNVGMYFEDRTSNTPVVYMNFGDNDQVFEARVGKGFETNLEKFAAIAANLKTAGICNFGSR